MSSWTWKAGLAGIAVAAATAYAVAQMPSEAPGGHRATHEPMMQHMQGGLHDDRVHGSAGHHGDHAGATRGQPVSAGQEAFGAIQEIVQLLEADPATDWSKVDIGALREHLIDMNEVTLRAVAAERPFEDGVEIAVTGEGRTLDAIRRMVPAHAAELAGLGWNAATETLPDGVMLTVRSDDAGQATKLKALGFLGILVQGRHHQPHHLMIARGERDIH